MSLSRAEIAQLIEWLGEDGAKGGLDKSFLSVKDLRDIASTVGIDLPSRAKRRDLASDIVDKVNQKIDKSVSELLAMSSSDLLQYFENVKPNKTELLSILSELDFHPGSEAQKTLYKYAAIQIAETGMFQRVATDS